MTTKELSLAEKVAERIKFLKTATDFAELITSKRGKNLLYDQASCHTHTIYELDNFNGFSFYADSGRTMFGGNQVKIWYHPTLPKNEGTPELVLDISWQVDVERCTHLRFNPNVQWQKELPKVVGNWESIAVEIDRAKSTAETKRLAQENEQKHQLRLEEVARRLQLI